MSVPAQPVPAPDPALPPAAPHADEPLGLTVHSLPSLQGMQDPTAQRTMKGRLKMLLVLLVCVAPVAASYFTYYVLRPESKRNYGELVDPQRPLPLVAALDLQGRTRNLQSLRSQWLLITVAGGACDATCQNHLYLQRQLRESLGKDKDRVDRVWLVTDAVPVATALLPALQGAQVLRVPLAELSRWLEPSAGHALGDHLYLVDPMGNWMMRFPAGMDLSGAAKAKRDLERLLRASSAWDQPGRPVP